MLVARDNMAGGRPREYKTEYIELIDDYLNDCEDTFDKEKNEYMVKLPTVEGFALFVGHNKTTIYEWCKEYPEFSNAIDKIKENQLNKLINKGLSGKYNPTIAKLLLSGNHNIREKTETDVTSKGESIAPISGMRIIQDGDTIQNKE